jgi:type IV pilus assembly protein PilX
MNAIRFIAHPRATRQRGVMLFIALIALAAMALVAVAMYRSNDLANLQSGNVALLQDQSNKADICVRRVMTWMSDSASGLDLNSGADQAAFNYFGTQFTPVALDARYGIARNLLTQPTNGWMGSAPDIDAGGGVRVNCVIERMCTRPTAADASHCQMSGAAVGGQGKDGSTFPSIGVYPAYRVTTRVDGVRGTTFSQVTLAPRSM